MKKPGSLDATPAQIGTSSKGAPSDSSDAPSLRHGWPLHYRNYRAFSWPWVRIRTIFLGAGGLALGAVATAGHVHKLGDWRLSALEFAIGAASWLLCAGLGPLLAALVLGRRWPGQRENAAVIGAIIIGAAIAAGSVVIVEAPFDREVLAPRQLSTGNTSADGAGRNDSDGKSGATGIAANPLNQFHGALRLEDFPRAFALSLLVGGGLALPVFFREKRHIEEQVQERMMDKVRLQKKEADLRLLVLQAQIEPHFLFNTLASLRSIFENDVGRAIAMIDALVEHLRATMPAIRDGDSASTLSQQIAICKSYLEVMKLRTGDRLNYRIDVPFVFGDMPFPPLMLLTLVENAVKHGIEPKPGPGMICIEAERRLASDGARTVVRVIDDGAGLRGGMGHGVGLANVREQLALRYRTRAALSLRARPEGGVEVTLEIPEGAAVD